MERFGRASSSEPKLHRLFEQLRAIASESYPVVLRGEHASGRETLARAMHEISRPAMPCIVVDLAAIPLSLVESTLFGYVKGSFTGQTTIQRGPFEEAESGTVVLRELGALHAELQPKLLRVVRERRFRRVGDNAMRPFNGRIIATTSRDLDTLVELGWMHAELRHEIARVEVEVPPLRDRLVDLPSLLPGASSQVIDRLARFAWRGNFARWKIFAAAFARDPVAAVTELELLEAIEAAPDDDGPRQVYADALASRGEQLGDWINLQLRLAQTPVDLALRAAEVKLRRQVTTALTHDVLDVAITPQATPNIWFDRGFIDHLSLFGEGLRNFDAILAVAPLLREISTYGELDSCNWTAPTLRALHRLDVSTTTNGDALRELARCPYLGNLRSLTLRNDLEDGTDPDLAPVASSPQLAGITRLTLWGYARVNVAILLGEGAAWTLTELATDGALSPVEAAALLAAPKARHLTALRVKALDPESRAMLTGSHVLTGATIYVDNQVLR